MRFGRVVGFVFPATDGERPRLTVSLETSGRIETVRDEPVALLGPPPVDLDWLADQYTQETIGVMLAAEGWEAIGLSEQTAPPLPGCGQSPLYTVRNLS